MPGYIAAIVLASGRITAWKKIASWTGFAIGVNILLISLVILQAHTGFIPLREKSDPTLDPAGWSETIRWMEKERVLLEDDVLFVHKWFTGGEVIWADSNRHTVVHIGREPHHFAWWTVPEMARNSSGIFLTQERYRLSENDYRDFLLDRFESVAPVTVPEIRRRGGDFRMLAWRIEVYRSPAPVPYGPNSGDP